MTTVDCDSTGYWREALFIASATHGEIPCAAIKLTYYPASQEIYWSSSTSVLPDLLARTAG
jgi:hypothetical protein